MPLPKLPEIRGQRSEAGGRKSAAYAESYGSPETEPRRSAERRREGGGRTSNFGLLTAGCWLLTLFTAAAQTDETAAAPAEPAAPLAFAARVESGEFIGTEQLRRLYVSVGTNQLGFVVPEGLRVDVSRADRITLTQSDLSFFLTVRIIANATLANDALRQQVLAHYPGALLLDETSLEAAGWRGPRFNLRWKPAEGVDRMVTMAFLPTTAGVLELDLVSNQAKSGEAQNALSGLLCRLQSCSGGKLRMETFRQPEHN